MKSSNSFVLTLMLVAVFTAGAVSAEIPRTPEGKPNFQGTWANNAATPLERPKQLADKSELTDEEVAEFQAKLANCLQPTHMM